MPGPDIRRPSCVPAGRPWPPQPKTAAASAGVCTGCLQLTGAVVERAELRHRPGAASILAFEVDVGAGFRYSVTQAVPFEPVALRAAEAKAALLTRGSIVHVYARGCVPRTDHGTAALWLLDVTDVIPTQAGEPSNAC